MAETLELLRSDAPIGTIRLRVSDLAHSEAFYEHALGLAALERHGDVVGLGPHGGDVLVELAAAPGAPARPAHTTGLYRLALALPSRNDLGVARHRAVEAGWSLTVGYDVGVAETLVLEDPEGNEVELYWDRPPSEWRDADGRWQMRASSLDFRDLGADLPDGGGASAAPPTTRVGHVHLHVSDLPVAEAFYRDVLGFEVTVTDVPGALFLATGGYHHHVALHYPEQVRDAPGAWVGVGAPAPPPGARGLERFEVWLRDGAALAEAVERLEAAGHDAVVDDLGVATTDPSGNGLLLRAADG
jgi:catechol 2,3-dioxygenase